MSFDGAVPRNLETLTPLSVAQVIEEEKRLAIEASRSNDRKKREKRHARGRDK